MKAWQAARDAMTATVSRHLADGGGRAGAGRPVESVTLRRSQKWLAHEFAADGRTIGLGRLVEAVEISRNRVLLRFDDGETLELIR